MKYRTRSDFTATVRIPAKVPARTIICDENLIIRSDLLSMWTYLAVLAWDKHLSWKIWLWGLNVPILYSWWRTKPVSVGSLHPNKVDINLPTSKPSSLSCQTMLASCTYIWFTCRTCLNASYLWSKYSDTQTEFTDWCVYLFSRKISRDHVCTCSSVLIYLEAVGSCCNKGSQLSEVISNSSL